MVFTSRMIAMPSSSSNINGGLGGYDKVDECKTRTANTTVAATPLASANSSSSSNPAGRNDVYSGVSDDVTSWSSARRRTRILLPPRPVYMPLRDRKHLHQQTQQGASSQGSTQPRSDPTVMTSQRNMLRSSNAPSVSTSPPVASPLSNSRKSTSTSSSSLSLSYSSSTSSSSSRRPEVAPLPSSPPTTNARSFPMNSASTSTRPKAVHANQRCRTDGSAASESSTTLGETLSHASSFTSLYTTNTATAPATASAPGVGAGGVPARQPPEVSAQKTRPPPPPPSAVRGTYGAAAVAARRLFSVDGSDDDNDDDNDDQSSREDGFQCHSGPVDVDQNKPIVDCCSRDEDEDDDDDDNVNDSSGNRAALTLFPEGPVDVDEVLDASNRLDDSAEERDSSWSSSDWEDLVMTIDEEDCSRELVGYHEGFEPCVIENVCFDVAEEDEEDEEEEEENVAAPAPNAILSSPSCRLGSAHRNPPSAVVRAKTTGAAKHPPANSALANLRPLALLRATTAAPHHHHHHPRTTPSGAGAAMAAHNPPPHPPAPLMPPKKQVQPGRSLHPKPKSVGRTFSI